MFAASLFSVYFSLLCLLLRIKMYIPRYSDIITANCRANAPVFMLYISTPHQPSTSTRLISASGEYLSLCIFATLPFVLSFVFLQPFH